MTVENFMLFAMFDYLNILKLTLKIIHNIQKCMQRIMLVYFILVVVAFVMKHKTQFFLEVSLLL